MLCGRRFSFSEPAFLDGASSRRSTVMRLYRQATREYQSDSSSMIQDRPPAHSTFDAQATRQESIRGP